MSDPAEGASPSARYAAGVGRGEWTDDPAQHPALRELDRLHAALLDSPKVGLLDRLRGKRPEPPRGLYLWGGVGRGKTFLIDLFFDGLPLKDVAAAGCTGSPSPARRANPSGSRATGAREEERPRRWRGPGREARWPEGPDEGTRETCIGDNTFSDSQLIDGPGKRRTHFHRFMREVHAQLRAHAGESDPLVTIAREWRRRLRVLVLDEFFVSDIGDAMLLARLLGRLFAEGVVLVTSSNTEPRDLYRDGLQRERFLPAIAQIERHCCVLLLDSAHDYRLRALTRSPVYRTPQAQATGEPDSEAWLQSRWDELTAGAPRGHDGQEQGPLRIEGRDIPVRALAEGHAWFDFAALCEGPRAASDYIEIATEHHTVLLGGIPCFDGRNDDAARRFVTLIDELYDRHVNLVCAAAAAPPELYTGHKLTGAFERTASRLIEMQSAEYLALAHRG
ncbi:cell division protein ZapE [Lysobacter sp. D1-1-M9]|uniref:cell division protein ZapE n=1 Tax=Novilysobacter longmucuonensis TaxID=3098603 RepID=UPI0039831B89